MRTKRRRFFFIFLFVLAFNVIGNVAGFSIARLERSARKYKKQYIMSSNPAILSYPSAIDTLYEPMKLSQVSTERLGDAFLRYDRFLKDGFSRLLIVRVLKSMGHLTDAEAADLLAQSGFKTKKAQLLSSVSMKDFYKLIESKIADDHSNELQFVDLFLANVEKEIFNEFDKNKEAYIQKEVA